MAQICTKSFVGWGFAPYRTGGAYSDPPDPLAGLRGPTSKGRGEGKGKEGERRGGKGRGGEGVPVKLGLEINPCIRYNNKSSASAEVADRNVTWYVL